MAGLVVGVVAARGSGIELLGLIVVALIAIGTLRIRTVVGGMDWLGPPALLAVIVALYNLVKPAALLAGVAPLAGDVVDMGTAMLLVLTAVAAFWTGYLLPVGKAWGASMPWSARGWSRSRVKVVVWGCWVVGSILWAGMIYKSGGVVARLTTYGGGSAAGLGVLVASSAALLGVALVTGWLGYLKGLVSRKAMVALVGTGGIMLALHGQRGALLVPLLVGVAVYHYLVRRLQGRQIILLGVAALALLAVLALPRLQLVRAQGLAIRASDYVRIGGWLVLRNLTSLDALMLTVAKVPQEIDYQWGRSYVDAVVMLVPRWLYEEKPQRNLFNRLLREGRGSWMAMPLPAEGLLNFGLAGVLLEAVFLGIVYRALYAYRARHPHNEGAILAYGLGVAFFGLIWRGGLLGGHLALLLPYGVLLGGVGVVCGGSRWWVTADKSRQ